MQNMLRLPTIASAWRKIRKSYDPQAPLLQFQHRAEARQLAVDLGFASDSHADHTTPDSHVTPDDGDADRIEDGWHCFSCPASSLLQPDSRQRCIKCKAPRD